MFKHFGQNGADGYASEVIASEGFINRAAKFKFSAFRS